MGSAYLPVASMAIANSRGVLRGKLLSFLRQATAFRANNVAKFYYESPRENWPLESAFPGCIPFADRVWIEYKVPETINIGGKIQRRAQGELFVALVCEDGTEAFLRSKEMQEDYVRLTGKAVPPLPEIMGLKDKLSGCRYEVLVVVPHAEPIVLGWMCIFVKKEVGATPILDKNGHTLFAINKTKFSSPQMGADTVFEFARIGLLSFSMASCRNIRIVDVPQEKPVGNREKRRSSVCAARIVELCVTKPVVKKNGALEQPGQLDLTTHEPLSRHMIRGHFKTYTPEKPLFGDRIGTYWWSQQWRGDDSAGVIEHVYT